MNGSYIIRPFAAAEAITYKSIRLEALLAEPGMFGNSYAMEASFEESHWSERVNNHRGCCFGLYYAGELIGVTSIIMNSIDRPQDAYMTQSYIRQAHRGKGLSRLLYDARLEWARSHGVKRLLIGHRASNIVSKAANQHYGFVYSHSEPRIWPDGTAEDMLYYELVL